ncbi:prephenate dehydrogenase [Punctularia strigosozonata HHB-11173 SS5]|uniref:prephenate dehydrogenase n=1 Tax=Punctularia strigosozonata (strain HHB-11173) TaxID=741275 RepID=UPI00044183F1|nr:prephenate dehydrogenase [Punctularia strigosozonata HHB-11173 SS5]EIN09383.1 prephenate dehydrogenase [Punctularia strigosozonata HHB-11173 SS5]
MDPEPSDPPDLQPTIGLIGMGAMGKMYAHFLSAAGWKKIHVCDRPPHYESLRLAYDGVPGITVLPDGHRVSRTSDFIMYSVEAEFIDRVVAEYGPSTKVGAIVSGQTSVKAPEKAAFEKYLPEDVHIVSCHSLHGPTVSPTGQPLVLIKHRAPDWALTLVESILRPLGSRFVYLSYEDHDLVTANTQAVTHAAFLSMGTAWSSSLSYPWEHGYYVGGIETVKVNIMLRIYSNQWHVYAGLAILNPSARLQIDQYARSVTELFKLMLAGSEAALRDRVYSARDTVFPYSRNGNSSRSPILLSEDVLDQFSLGKKSSVGGTTSPSYGTDQSNTSPKEFRPPANSHLSLLAMVDCWAHLGIQPFVHLELAATPIFRMWLGVAESLFCSQERLDGAIHAAVHDVSHRSDDLEFVVAARGWSQCVSFGSFELYKQRFTQTASFFSTRFEEATKIGSAMLQTIMESEIKH